MKLPRSLLLSMLSAFALAGGAALAQDWGRTPPPDEASVVRGRFIAFGGMHGEASWSCAQCHGLTGAGDSSGAFPRLAEQGAWYLFKSLQDYAAGLRPNEAMQRVAQRLTPEQMRDVAAWYASVEDVPHPAPPPEGEGELLQLGAVIATAGLQRQGVPACQSCHGARGVGQPPHYPYLAGQFAPYTAHQLQLWKEGLRDGDPMNVMELIAKNMTDRQIRAVSLYFASLRPEEVMPLDAEPPGETARVVGAQDAAQGIVRERPAAMGAVQEPDVVPGTQVAPGVEPRMGPAPDPEFPLGPPRRPPQDVAPLPPAARETDMETVTTTGRGVDPYGPSGSRPEEESGTGDR